MYFQCVRTDVECAQFRNYYAIFVDAADLLRRVDRKNADDCIARFVAHEYVANRIGDGGAQLFAN